MTAAPPPRATRGPAATRTFEPLEAILANPTKHPRVMFAILAGGGLVFLLVAGLIVWRLTASSVPGAAGDALESWEDGKYEEAEAVLKTELTKTPALASDPALHAPLVASVHDDKARTAFQRLLDTTALGRSAPLATTLAEIGLEEEASARRNGALRLLRGRHDLLPKEQRVRVALRDPDDCAALAKAVNDLAGAGSGAEADAKRYREGQCRKLLRREELCGCPPPGSGRGRGKKGGGKL